MEDEFNTWEELDETNSEEPIEEEDDQFLWEDTETEACDSFHTGNSPNTENSGWESDASLEHDVDELQKRAEGIERAQPKHQVSFGNKWCPTRHGCQGTTDCDYCMGNAK